MEDLKTNLVGNVGTLAGLALAAVGLVWLIACANASNLLIARVTSRRQELAVRAALGASRGRVLRYLLAESVVLAAGAVALGVGVAWAGMQLLQTQGATYFPRTQEIRFDAPMMLADGRARDLERADLRPRPGTACHRRIRWTPSLRSGRTVAGGAGVRRLRRSLVAAQFAIATPLLIVAALLLTSLDRLRQVDLGFDTAQRADRIDPVAGRAVSRRRRASTRSGTSCNAGSRRCPAWPRSRSRTDCRRTPPASTTTSISSSTRRGPASRSR